MQALKDLIAKLYEKDCAACTNEELYAALLTYTKEQLAGKSRPAAKKRLYYISAEFLLAFTAKLPRSWRKTASP